MELIDSDLVIDDGFATMIKCRGRRRKEEDVEKCGRIEALWVIHNLTE